MLTPDDASLKMLSVKHLPFSASVPAFQLFFAAKVSFSPLLPNENLPTEHFQIHLI